MIKILSLSYKTPALHFDEKHFGLKPQSIVLHANSECLFYIMNHKPSSK